MNARAEREIPIRYLSVDEMMLKIAEMRAARVVREMALSPGQHAPRESVEPLPGLEFPDYIRHCEASSAGAKAVEADDIARIPPLELLPSQVVPSRTSVSRVQPVAARNLRPSPPAKMLLDRYVFAAMTAGIAGLLLVAGVLQLRTGAPAMQMMASADRGL